MVCAEPWIPPGEWDEWNYLGFWDASGSSSLSQATGPSDNQQKKRTYRIVYFGVQVNHRVKLKEIEKRDKYLDLARELENLWNMKVTVIPIVIGALGSVT